MLTWEQLLVLALAIPSAITSTLVIWDRIKKRTDKQRLH
jgi:hypothetical protein